MTIVASDASRVLARRRLDERLADVPQAVGLRPPAGWVRAIRDALGMSATDMARRMGVTRPRIASIEKAEAAGEIKVSTLERAAAALGCRLVYAIVPMEGSLEDAVQRQARTKALERRDRAAHAMRLEDQATVADERALEELVRELATRRDLWK